MNKVKYNLKNAHFATLTEGEDGTFVYDTPIAIPGAVSLSLAAQGNINKFYADGIVYYQTASNNGYEGDLEVALIPEKFRTNVLGETLDSNNVLVENTNAKTKAFALLFEFEGDTKGIRHVMYNCTATRPSIESQTTEEEVDPVTEKLTISAAPRSDGKVKAKTGDSVTDETYNNWYKTVYDQATTTEE